MRASFIAAGLFSFVIMVGCGSSASPTNASPIPAGTLAARGAVSVPLRGSFEGSQTVTPGPPPFATVAMTATGEATHLGRFEIALPHTVNFATSTATGICTMIAADGSTITANFTGQAELGPVVTIVEQATITGGTGRFAGAGGTFTINRTFNPATGVTTGELSGTLEMAKGNR